MNYALWDDHTTSKTIHGKTPFMLINGQEASMPSELEIATYRLAFQTKEIDNSPIIQRFNFILVVEEQREFRLESIQKRQAIIKKRHDKKAKERTFHVC